MRYSESVDWICKYCVRDIVHMWQYWNDTNNIHMALYHSIIINPYSAEGFCMTVGAHFAQSICKLCLFCTPFYIIRWKLNMLRRHTKRTNRFDSVHMGNQYTNTATNVEPHEFDDKRHATIANVVCEKQPCSGSWSPMCRHRWGRRCHAKLGGSS